MNKPINKCDSCGKSDVMEYQENGSVEYHEEWMECKICGFTRELTSEEIDYNLEMRY